MNRHTAIIVVLILAGIFAFTVGITYYGKVQQRERSAISNFEECANAGYPIMESYPRQCRTPDGKLFVEIVPVITDLSPSSGPVHTQVTISGSGFTLTGNKVYFGIPGGMRGVIPDLPSPDGKTIVFAAPDGLNIECNPGKPCVEMYPQVHPGIYDVSVTNANGATNVMPASFTVTENEEKE